MKKAFIALAVVTLFGTLGFGAEKENAKAFAASEKSAAKSEIDRRPASVGDDIVYQNFNTVIVTKDTAAECESVTRRESIRISSYGLTLINEHFTCRRTMVQDFSGGNDGSPRGKEAFQATMYFIKK